jgi:hypothetical protein
MRRTLVCLSIVVIALCTSCKNRGSSSTASDITTTKGNATDRSADGTTGTGEPHHVANDSAASAVALGTMPTSSVGTAPIAVTGTEVVRPAATQTTGTFATPTTTTISVATPTDTSSTVHTPQGTTTQKH